MSLLYWNFTNFPIPIRIFNKIFQISQENTGVFCVKRKEMSRYGTNTASAPGHYFFLQNLSSSLFIFWLVDELFLLHTVFNYLNKVLQSY